MKTRFLAGWSLLAILQPEIVHAQVSTPTDTPVTSTSSEDQGAAIGDIVVTAQRRQESLQKSSISIQAIGADALLKNGVSEAKDLAAVAPGISIAQTGPFTQTNIRGAGDLATNVLAPPAVSYSLDGLVFGSSVGVSNTMYDLARVEILMRDPSQSSSSRIPMPVSRRCVPDWTRRAFHLEPIAWPRSTAGACVC